MNDKLNLVKLSATCHNMFDLCSHLEKGDDLECIHAVNHKNGKFTNCTNKAAIIEKVNFENS